MSREIWREIIEWVRGFDTLESDELSDRLDSLYTVSKKSKKVELVYPYSSIHFNSTWNALIQEPKWKKKSPRALQQALKFLSTKTESDAIQIMEQSIMGGYQGLFELKNSKQNGKPKNNGHESAKIGRTTEDSIKLFIAKNSQ